MSGREPTNAERADWAREAVNTFAIDTYCGRTFDRLVVEQPDAGGDAYTAIQDLMTNLMHLARRQGWDPEKITAAAALIFNDEEAEEAEEADAFAANGALYVVEREG